MYHASRSTSNIPEMDWLDVYHEFYVNESLVGYGYDFDPNGEYALVADMTGPGDPTGYLYESYGDHYFQTIFGSGWGRYTYDSLIY